MVLVNNLVFIRGAVWFPRLVVVEAQTVFPPSNHVAATLAYVVIRGSTWNFSFYVEPSGKTCFHCILRGTTVELPGARKLGYHLEPKIDALLSSKCKLYVSLQSNMAIFLLGI